MSPRIKGFLWLLAWSLAGVTLAALAGCGQPGRLVAQPYLGGNQFRTGWRAEMPEGRTTSYPGVTRPEDLDGWDQLTAPEQATVRAYFTARRGEPR